MKGFDEDGTPLQKSFQKRIEDKKAEVASTNPACQAAIESGNQGEIQKNCKVPKITTSKILDKSGTLTHSATGKAFGKKITTDTTIEYDNPEQRDMTKWPKYSFPGAAPNLPGNWSDAGPHSPVQSRMLDGRTSPAALSADAGKNDDRDCLDRRNKKHVGGALQPGLDPVVDGAPDSCFDATGQLKVTLQALPLEGGCRYIGVDGTANGPKYLGTPDTGPNDCYDESGNLRTTLVELIDEGPPSGDDYGNDPAASAVENESACRNFGGGHGDVESDGGCDLTRAMVIEANRQFKQKANKKFFKADDNGNCSDDPNAEGEFACGAEPRRLHIEETLVARCKGGGEYVDGECRIPERVGGEGALENGVAFASTMAFAGGPMAADSTSEVKRRALMGFTFAPPVLEWGWKVDEEACFLGICIELFYARVGYELELAAGLRLPVEVTVHSVPSSIVAEQSASFTADIEPLDFAIKDYKQICNENNLADSWYIDTCDRFAFPDFWDQLWPGRTGDDKDGQEFVAEWTVFAGVQVRVLSIPVFNIGILSSANIPVILTVYNTLQKKDLNVISALKALASGEFIDLLKTTLNNVGSFTTPWGYKDTPFGKQIRNWPMGGDYYIQASCEAAALQGKVITIGDKPRPICTALQYYFFGLGLDVRLDVGSGLIESTWNTAGDAANNVGDRVIPFRWESPDSRNHPSFGPVTFDNRDASTGDGKIQLSNFTYYVNKLALTLKVKPEVFGTPLVAIPIFQVDIDTGDLGIPIGQHPGTTVPPISVPVDNYALELQTNPKTLKIKPGDFGSYSVKVMNAGTVPGNFDAFTTTFSNHPNQTPPYAFGIDPNTDHDCVDGTGKNFRGNPYDSVADGCFNADGTLKAGMTQLLDEDSPDPSKAGRTVAENDDDRDGLADEDPPDVWRSVADRTQISSVPAGQLSTEALKLDLSPFLHPLTAPGVYPVQIKADSVEAKALGLKAMDPLGNYRLGAPEVIFIQVESFFDPRLTATPAAATGKPGVTSSHSVEGVNRGNSKDGIAPSYAFPNFNNAGCTLVTMGALSGCPYRAAVTQVAEKWTTLPATKSLLGPLDPLGSEQDGFTITPPSDWAGMVDTVYDVVLTATSTLDPGAPKAANSSPVKRTVIATKESMTRYVGLEIQQILETLQKAKDEGSSTAGMLPVQVHPILTNNNKALGQILAGDLDGATKLHTTNLRLMAAFARMLEAAKLTATQYADMKARSDALIADITAAANCTVAPGSM